MRWYELTVHTMDEATEMISNFMMELGAGGVSIEESSELNKHREAPYGEWYDLPTNHIPAGEVHIKGYFSRDIHLEGTLVKLEQSIKQLSDFNIAIGDYTISSREIDDQDWANAWKQYYKPVRISQRLTIKPTWEAYDAEEGELIVELDPGMAFGTGTHATTALCLRTLEKVIMPGDEVIDVGTGSGVLAIAAAKLGAKHVLAIDLDPVAVSSATENAELNRMSEHITVIESDLLQVITQAKQDAAMAAKLGVSLPVTVVVANILAEIIITFVDDVYEALQPGGRYIASGIITARQAMVEEALQAAGFIIADRYQEEDWLAIVAEKR